MNRRLSDRIRRGEPISWPIAAALTGASYATRAGMAIRKMQSAVDVGANVISIGNITAGGTGKTPAVIERAQRETDRGRNVAVLTRGYHGALGNGLHVIPENPDDWVSIALDYGDEPALIAFRVPGVRVVKCPDRVTGARHATGLLGCDTLILDDGFQYLRIARDENIVCIDATNPFGNGHIVPRGNLREPVEALERATQIVVTRCDQVEDLSPLKDRLQAIAPDCLVRYTWHKPTGLWCVCDGEEMPLSFAQEATQTICGVGNPEAFAETVRSLGANIDRVRVMPNHGQIRKEDFPFGDMVIVTEKDAIKMADPPENIYALRIDLADWGGEEAELF